MRKYALRKDDEVVIPVIGISEKVEPSESEEQAFIRERQVGTNHHTVIDYFSMNEVDPFKLCSLGEK